MESSMKILILAVLLLAAFLLGFLYVKYRSRRERGRYLPPKGRRQHVTLESKDLGKTAQQLLPGLGGRENIRSVTADGARLRIEIAQYSAVNETLLRDCGVGGVLRPSKTLLHIIVGERAEELAEQLREAAGL